MTMTGGKRVAEGSDITESEQSLRKFRKLSKTMDDFKISVGRASVTTKNFQEDSKPLEVSDQDEEPARKLDGDIQDLYEWIKTSQ